MSYSSPPSQPPTPQWGQPPVGPPTSPRSGGPGWARKRIFIPAGVVLFLFGAGIGASGGSGTTTAADSKAAPAVTKTATATVTVTAKPAAETAEKVKPAPTVTVTKTTTVAPKAKPKPKAVTIPGDGTFVVGDEVQPGTYKTSGPADSAFPNCYWARLKSTTGDFDDIIANDNPKGQTTITISSSDGAFESSGCEEWKKVG